MKVELRNIIMDYPVMPDKEGHKGHKGHVRLLFSSVFIFVSLFIFPLLAALLFSPWFSLVQEMDEGHALQWMNAHAQTVERTKPGYKPVIDPIPVSYDIPFPGEMTLNVDARDIVHGVYKVEQEIPINPAMVNNGEVILLFPEWIPGNHAPRGELDKLVNLNFMVDASSSSLEWRRNPVHVYAFHIKVPEGIENIRASFQFVSSRGRGQGRVVVTREMQNLRWHNVSLYPAGYFVRNIMVRASAHYPPGWRDASALRAERNINGKVRYKITDYETLLDSPVFAGKYFKRWSLSDNVWLNVVADAPEMLEASDEQVEHHRKLVVEAEHLFGGRPYDRYDFLLALSNRMSSIGIEHHRSSENGVNTGYFTKWDKGVGRRGLLPHELVHAWNGKYKRPQAMWTPDYHSPMVGDLLWVYEGQTQFWGNVLNARSGLFSKEQALDNLANVAARQMLRVGRSWRSLLDTTYDPIIARRMPKPWTSWQRAEDYYNDGYLIWLKADQIIRNASGGERSLQDFARRFFKGANGDWGVDTYDLKEVVDNLSQVQPYDWNGFLQRHIYAIDPVTAIQGIEMGGYKLVFTQERNDMITANEKSGDYLDLLFSLGMRVSKSGRVTAIIWDSPAFKGGLNVGDVIDSLEIDDEMSNRGKYTIKLMEEAVANTLETGIIDLEVNRDGRLLPIRISYGGGHRFPHLEPVGDGPAGLDLLFAPQLDGDVDG